MSDETPPWDGIYYVLRCLDCGGDPIIFPTPQERGAWAAAHTQGTGHERWHVMDHKSRKRGREYENGPIHHANDGCTDHA